MFAALALPAQLLQLRLALLQTLPFALVLRLVLLERRLVGGAVQTFSSAGRILELLRFSLRLLRSGSGRPAPPSSPAPSAARCGTISAEGKMKKPVQESLT